MEKIDSRKLIPFKYQHIKYKMSNKKIVLKHCFEVKHNNHSDEIQEELQILRKEFSDVINRKNHQTTIRDNKFLEISEFREKMLSIYGNDTQSYVKKLENSILISVDETNINDLDPELIFVEEYDQKNKRNYYREMYNYFRIHTSSVPGSHTMNRNIQVLVRDKTSEKYIGIFSIGSDFNSLTKRDNYIGWNNKARKLRIKYVSNIVCCIGLQPFAFNTNGGKLITKLAFSKEMQEFYKRKYGHYIAGITVTSIDGKSVQYEGLKEVKYFGETKGHGSCHIPEELYQKGLQMLKKCGYGVDNDCQKTRMFRLKQLAKLLELDPKKITYHNIVRGIYFGYTGINSQEFLCDEIDDFSPIMRPVRQICDEWKPKAIQRFHNCEAKNKLKYGCEFNLFYDNYKNAIRGRQYRCNNLEIIRRKDRQRKKQHNLRIKEKQREFIFDPDMEVDHEFKKQILDIYKDIKLTPSYLGGLFDGDGSIYIDKTGCIGVNFAQCWYPIMLILQKQYGGLVSAPKYGMFDVGEKTKAKRSQYSWRVTGTNTGRILTDLEKGCITKLELVQIASKCYQYLNMPNKKDKRLKYRQKLLEARAKIPKKKKEDIDMSRLNNEYLTGIFDAEGCIIVRDDSNMFTDSDGNKTNKISKHRLKISQKMSPALLHAIHEKMGFGYIETRKDKDDGRYVVSWNNDSKCNVDIIDMMLEHSTVKLNQLKLYKLFLSTFTGSYYNDEIHKTRLLAKEQIFSDKVFDWKIDRKTINRVNDISKKSNAKFRNEIKTEKKILAREAGKEQVDCPDCGRKMSLNALNRHKRENCKANSDPKVQKAIEEKQNYLKSLDHMILKSINITLGKDRCKIHAVSDKIRGIKQLKTDNPSMTNEVISKQFGCDRNYVASVLKGDHPEYDTMTEEELIEHFKNKALAKLKKNEEKQKIKEQKAEQLSAQKIQNENVEKHIIPILTPNNKTSIGKRQMAFETALEIVKLKHIRSNKEVVDRNYPTKTGGKTVSKDMIRNLWEGKSQLFEAEFSPDSIMTYQEYLEIIQKKASNNKSSCNCKLTDAQIKDAIKYCQENPNASHTQLGRVKKIHHQTANKIKQGILIPRDASDDEKILALKKAEELKAMEEAKKTDG